MALFFLVVTAFPARAQQDDPNLPDIAPREVEIRGEGEVALPTLERQPIRELAPPPALLNQPGRMPRAAPDTLAPLRLPQPSTEPDLTGADRTTTASLAPHGSFEATGGRYWTRSLAGRVDWPFSAQTHLSASFSYDDTEGHHPFETTAADPASSSDVLEGRGALTTGSEAWTVTTEAGGMLTDYNLYGAAGTGGSFASVPERQGQSGHVSAEVQGLRTRRASLNAALTARSTSYTTALSGTADRERSEQRLGGEFSVEVPFSSLAWYAGASAAAAGLNDTTGRSGVTPLIHTYADGETGLRFSLGALANASLGLHAMAYRNDAVSATYLAPAARLAVHPASSLEIYARNAPDIEPNRLATLFRTNPYLVSQPTFLPVARTATINAEGGLRWTGSVVQLTVFGGYVHAPTQRFFHQDETSRRAFIAASYAETNVAKGGARLNLMAPGSFQIALSGEVRRGRLAEQDQPIPYFSTVTGEISALYFFEGGELEATGEILGPRDARIESSDDVGAYFGLDLSARYRIAPPLGLVVRLENAAPGALERWKHYPEPPLVVSGGLSASW